MMVVSRSRQSTLCPCNSPFTVPWRLTRTQYAKPTFAELLIFDLQNMGLWYSKMVQ